MLKVAALLGVATMLLVGCSEVVETGPQAEPGEGFGDVVVTVPPSTSAAPTTAASTTAGAAAGLAFDPGDCLTWNDEDRPVVYEVVPCDQEHLAEVAGRGDLGAAFDEDDRFPSTAVLSSAVTEVCTPVIEQYLAGADPGAVEGGVIPPTEAAWEAGERGVWCTVGLPRQDQRRTAYTGRLADDTAG